MEYRKFKDTYVVRMNRGEEILTQVKALTEQEHIQLASIQALGAVNDFTVGVFDAEKKVYLSNHFQGSFEIVSLTGTIDTMDGQPYFHLHMSAADQNGHVFGGHLNEAHICATCEMIVRCIDGQVDRYHDQELGLNLFRFL